MRTAAAVRVAPAMPIGAILVGLFPVRRIFVFEVFPVSVVSACGAEEVTGHVPAVYVNGVRVSVDD
jgi:hypothetical protein